MGLTNAFNDAINFLWNLIINKPQVALTFFNALVIDLGLLIYGFFFIIIFCETGLVVFPFFPGDSLIFVAGALSAPVGSALNVFGLLVIFSIAAITGNIVNYWIGRMLGPKVFTQKSRLWKQEYLQKAQDFYDKHGPVTIVITRFIPVIRTYAPFVAGIGKMKFSRFLIYNIIGGVAWVCLFLFTGYFFGTIPWVQENLSYIVYLIVIVSLLPVIIKALQGFIYSRKEKTASRALTGENTNDQQISSPDGEMAAMEEDSSERNVFDEKEPITPSD